MKEEVIIIGGGLGGLTTGALLAKEGHRVTVLEKNETIGGGLQTFKRNGIEFETGMHILGGFRPGGSLYRICSYLGILHRLRLRSVDNDCMDSITYASDGVTYRIAAGREGFVESLAAYFPKEKEHLKRYVDTLYALTEELDVFYLRPTNDDIFQHSEQFLWAADRLIAHYINDLKLRDVLAYMNPMYGGIAGHTPAYIHALINVLYINGPDRFEGGSLQLAEALKEVIEQGGGHVLNKAEAARIEVVDKQVKRVVTTDGRSFSAPYYISATHVGEMLRIADDSAFPKSYVNRLRSIPGSYSIFSLFIELKEGVFPYINHTCYYQTDYEHVWHLGEYDAHQWPYGFMYMTPPDINQGATATHLIVNCIMPFDVVRRWEDTKTGKRGAEYKTWKLQHQNRVIAGMEKIYPEFRQMIKHVHAASPLTVRDYYHSTEGSIYGFAKDCENFLLSQVPIFTKVRNLFLTGQCVSLHGICGVPLSAINTAEAIVGRNKIIEKL